MHTWFDFTTAEAVAPCGKGCGYFWWHTARAHPRTCPRKPVWRVRCVGLSLLRSLPYTKVRYMGPIYRKSHL